MSAVVFASSCKPGGEAPPRGHATAADTSKTVSIDNGAPDTAKTAAPRHRHRSRKAARRRDGGPPVGAVDAALARLAPGEVRYIGPDTMVVGQTVPVFVKLVKGTRFPQTPLPHKQVITGETKMGDSARVCLSANVDDFTISSPDGSCSKQAVSDSDENSWSWLVTPHRPGSGLLQVQVTALLAGMPGKSVYDSSYAVVVSVAPRSFLARMTDLLKTWEGILTSIAACVTAIAVIVRRGRAGKKDSVS